MFWKIVKTILSILLPPVAWWYMWKGTKIIPFISALLFPIRLLLFILGIFIWPIAWFIAIWGIWIKS